MPQTSVVFYQETKGASEVVRWMRELRAKNHKAFLKCVARIERLEQLGHELRRPEADYLRDEIDELRARLGTVNYRLLYFFHGNIAAVLACGLTKEGGVPGVEIDRAIKRKHTYRKDPAAHTFTMEDAREE